MIDASDGPQRPAGHWHTWISRLKRWLLAGLIIISPAFITFIALNWLFAKVDQPLRGALARFTGHDVPGAGIVMTLLLLVATGAVANHFVMRGALHWLERLLDRIPLVRTLYSGVKQLLAPLAEEHGGAFQKVVMIEYPDPTCYSLGFLIKADAGIAPTGELLSAVLVPTNHLHLGNVVLLPSQRIHHVDLTAEQGLRFLVSMGAALDKKLVIGAMPRSLERALTGARSGPGRALDTDE